MRHDPASGAVVIMLRSLKMHGMAQAVTDLIEQGAPVFEAAVPILTQLLKAEVAEREVRSIAYHMKAARFPAYKDLAGFDFSASEINESTVRQLHRCEFIDGAQNVVLIGGPGTGKTHVATALGIQAGEKVYQDFALEIRNPGGHSSTPVPDNAIRRMSAALARVAPDSFPIQTNGTTRAFFAATAEMTPAQAADMRAIAAGEQPDLAAAERVAKADKSWNSTLRTTCVPTLVNGGHAPNALPQRATANVNCRMFPGASVASVQARLAELLGDPGIAITPTGTADISTPPPLSEEIVGPIKAISAKMWPGVPLVPTQATGATDGRFTNAAGIPTYGFTAFFHTPEGSYAHGLNERMPVRSLYEGRDFLYELVRTYAAR